MLLMLLLLLLPSRPPTWIGRPSWPFLGIAEQEVTNRYAIGQTRGRVMFRAKALNHLSARYDKRYRVFAHLKPASVLVLRDHRSGQGLRGRIAAKLESVPLPVGRMYNQITPPYS